MCNICLAIRRGAAMIGMSGLQPRDAWMRRVRAVASEQQPVAPAADDLPAPGAGDKLPGWDPYDVWLHRIRGPRQRREGTED
jgi:hypothetical protein